MQESKKYENIKKELKNINQNYELEYVCNTSEYLTDRCSYFVIAHNTKQSNYILYTGLVDENKANLFWGHYDLTLTKALELLAQKRKEFEV